MAAPAAPSPSSPTPAPAPAPALRFLAWRVGATAPGRALDLPPC
uniref:Uncharacterized protein n=1 Tax=Arundo donax TaxID=35708 RepID=A0A0A9BS72_ARUDO